MSQLVRALEAFRQGKWQATIDRLDVQWSKHTSTLSAVAPEEDDDFSSRLHLAALALFNLGQVKKARVYMARCLKRAPDDPVLLCNMAKIELAIGAIAVAEKHLLRALELEDFVDAKVTLAQLNVGQGQYSEARRWYREALQGDSDNTNIAREYAGVLYACGALSEAAQIFLRLVSLEPENALSQRGLASCWLGQGHLQRAAEVFERVLKLQPDCLEAAIQLSGILNTLHKPEQAQARLEQTLLLKPWYTSSDVACGSLTLLTFAGVTRCIFDLDQHNRIKLDRGHFLTRALLPEQRFRRHRYYLKGAAVIDADSLPQYDVLLNTISDPDLESEALEGLLDFLQRAGNPVIVNHPGKILLTNREDNFRRFEHEQQVRFPRTVKLLPAQTALLVEQGVQALDGFKLPLLLREAGTQTGSSFTLCRQDSDLAEFVQARPNHELYAIEFIDTTFAPQRYRRFRFFFIDGQLYPVTCHIHDHWNVHSINRSKLMLECKDLQALEEEFLVDPEACIGADNMRWFEALPQRIGLDFFGCDFSLDARGRAVIFEINAAMNHSYDYVDKFSYLKPHLQRIDQAFWAMLASRAAKVASDTPCNG